MQRIFLCALLLCCSAAADTFAAEPAPAWSKSLSEMPHQVLFEDYADDNWDLHIMHADGSNRRKLTDTPDIHELYPQASPDGTKICFLADIGSGRKTQRSIFVMNADGTDRKLVAENARQPCWSPDSKRIAFVNQEFKRFNILDYVSKGLFIHDLETGTTREVPNKKVHHLYGLTWSADGKWIVSTVHGGMGFGHAIIAIEVDGQRVRDLKIPGCRPCLSPDGQMITWSSNDHTVNVGRINWTDDGPQVVESRALQQDKVLHLYHPDFSPDGKLVTYSAGPGGRVPASGPGTHTQVAEMIGVRADWNLFVIPVSGDQPAVKLTDHPEASSKESEWIRAGAASDVDKDATP